MQGAGSGATGPQGAFAGAGGQHGIDLGVGLQPLQGADGGEDDEEVAGRVACQGVVGADPHRLELLGLVRYRLLPCRHTGHQEGHVEAARQVAVGDPVRQHEHLIRRQLQALGAALVEQGGITVQCSHGAGVGHAAIGVARQQDAQFLETFADGGDGLGQGRAALLRAVPGEGMGGGISGVDAAARKDVGARGEAGRHGAPGHQHFDAGLAVGPGAVAQQQHGGGGPQGGGFTLGVQELAGACHHGIMLRG